MASRCRSTSLALSQLLRRLTAAWTCSFCRSGPSSSKLGWAFPQPVRVPRPAAHRESHRVSLARTVASVRAVVRPPPCARPAGWRPRKRRSGARPAVSRPRESTSHPAPVPGVAARSGPVPQRPHPNRFLREQPLQGSSPGRRAPSRGVGVHPRPAVSRSRAPRARRGRAAHEALVGGPKAVDGSGDVGRTGLAEHRERIHHACTHSRWVKGGAKHSMLANKADQLGAVGRGTDQCREGVDELRVPGLQRGKRRMEVRAPPPRSTATGRCSHRGERPRRARGRVVSGGSLGTTPPVR